MSQLADGVVVGSAIVKNAWRMEWVMKKVILQALRDKVAALTENSVLFRTWGLSAWPEQRLYLLRRALPAAANESMHIQGYFKGHDEIVLYRCA